LRELRDREAKVPKVVALAKELAKPLNRRRPVTVELPEFAIRAIHWRVDEANADDEAGEHVTFNDVVEWLLITDVTMKRMPLIEQSIPGFTAAMFVWLMEATYQPEDD
jgi:predicted transcriptional regulator